MSYRNKKMGNKKKTYIFVDNSFIWGNKSAYMKYFNLLTNIHIYIV